MRAVILAAGQGSRLGPLTRMQPKVMIPVANLPILEYVVEALVANDVKDITLVVGYRKERVQSHFEDGKRFKARIRYAFQDPPLGTAHALAQAEAGKDGVLVLSGDNVVDPKLVADLLKAGDGCAMVVQPSDNPSKYGVVTLQNGRVENIAEKPRDAVAGVVSTGVYALPADFRTYLHDGVKRGRYGLPELLQEYIGDGHAVRGILSKGLWMDVVHPWDLLRVNAAIQERLPPKAAKGGVALGKGVEVRPGAAVVAPAVLGDGVIVEPNAVLMPTCAIGDGVTIGAGTVIENSVVFAGAQIGPGSVITNSVLAAGVRAGARLTALSGPCEVRSEEGYVTVPHFGAVIGEDTVLEGAATLEPGTILGVRSRVGAGVRARGTVEDGAILR